MAESVESAGSPQPKAAERIRRTARDLFYREGIRAVGVDTIVSCAGVTKPTLYRSFASKDELAATYVSDYDLEFWDRFEGAGAGCAGDPRRHVLNYLEILARRSTSAGYRGCGMSNAAVEYPEEDHPARRVVEERKRLLRDRLTGMAREMGASDPRLLADGLLLLIEGAFISGQMFREHGPSGSVAKVAEMLIDANVRREK